MKRQLYGLLTGLLSLCMACSRESATPEQSGAFIKFLGGVNADKAYAAEPVPDGGYICVGTTNSFGQGGSNIYVMKVDVNGNSEWEEPKTFGGDGDDEGKSVRCAPDGGFYVLGNYTNENGLKVMRLIKTDAIGNEQWNKDFNYANRNEDAYSLSLTASGGCLLIGTIAQTNATTDVHVVQTTASGEKQWEKIYGLNGLNDGLGAVIETPDGNLVWCGASYRSQEGKNTGTSDVRVVMTTPEGNIRWDRNYGKENSETGAHVQSVVGGLVVVGTSSDATGSTDVNLLKLFPDGTENWTRTLGGTRNETGNAICPTNDGGYIITGSTESFGEGGKDIYLLKTDASGSQVWQQTFGGKLDDTGSSVRQTADGGYLVLGTITFENNTMLCLIKTNASGELD